MKSGSATLLSIATVPVVYAAFRLVGQFGPSFVSADWVEGALKILLWGVPSVLVIAATRRLSVSGALSELGLSSAVLDGWLFGLVAALPMLALVVSTGIARPSVSTFVGSVLLGPIAEEILFRGLLFRQLYRRGRRSPVRAMVVSALAFGFAHLSNVDISGVASVAPAMAEVGTATLGGLLFAWIVYQWDSLWPAIGLHAFMNLSWELSGSTHWSSHTPIGVGAGRESLARTATVVLALGLTWLRRRQRTQKRPDDASVARPLV